MNLKLKILSLAVAGLTTCSALQGQKKYEISVVGGAGLSTLNFDTSIGTQKNGFGGLVGVNYIYFINDNWGLLTGAEFSIYNSKSSFTKAQNSYLTVDIEGEPFEFRSTINDYNEKQNAKMLAIPLMVQYQTLGQIKFYIAAGAKIVLPIDAKYESTIASLNTSGYYPFEDEIYENQEFMGFGSFDNLSETDNLKLSTAFQLSLESGIKWNILETKSLYTGLYVDYGLNNVVKKSSDYIVEYNADEPENFKINSMLSSMYTSGTGDNITKSNFTKKIVPFAVGLKFRFAF